MNLVKQGGRGGLEQPLTAGNTMGTLGCARAAETQEARPAYRLRSPVYFLGASEARTWMSLAIMRLAFSTYIT